MARKKTVQPDGTGMVPADQPRRRTARGPAARPVSAELDAPRAREPLAAADDMHAAPAEYQPTYDEIAEAAYLRYLQRGGHHGQDFDDWLEAERALKRRRE